MAESVVARLSPALGRAEAHRHVTRVCVEAARRGQPLREALLAEPAVTGQLSATEVDAALDPTSYLGCAQQFIDRALARHAALTAAHAPVLQHAQPTHEPQPPASGSA